jgi:hypothetical protein
MSPAHTLVKRVDSQARPRPFEEGDQVGKPGSIATLTVRYPGVTIGPAPRRTDTWRALAGAARAARDALRYLHPRYGRADRLRERAVVWPLGPLLDLVAGGPFGSPAGLRILDRALAGVESIVPSSRAVERFIRVQRPDAVLVTPLVDFNSPQTEHVKAARALGVPVGVPVASWDNLTNKGLIKILPDLVTVWNEHQVREAVELHGVERERVVVTGAPLFDEWFARRPSTTRDEFCRRVGLPADRPIVLYACSSAWIAPVETGFVMRWLTALRERPGPLGTAGVLIRPHPQNAEQWRGLEVSDLGPVAIWPREPAAQVTEESKAGFYDSLHHGAAVVGINTSAMIEAGIVGRPVFAPLAPEFRGSQEGTLHFRYLLEAGGGLLQVGATLDQHLDQLADALADPSVGREQARRFVASFVRPLGLDCAATPILADAIERLAARRDVQPERTPPWAMALRPVLGGAALIVHVAWGLLSRRDLRGGHADR